MRRTTKTHRRTDHPSRRVHHRQHSHRATVDWYTPEPLEQRAYLSAYVLNAIPFVPPSSGYSPTAGVVLDPSGDLFGTTSGGGANGDGTVFEIANGKTAITTLGSFSDLNFGSSLRSSVILDASGDLFGTTPQGGTSGEGTVFEIAHGTTSITTLASFTGSNGIAPLAGVTIDSSGDLFGTTEGGGASNYGTVFEIVHGTTSITTLASFNGTNGEYPVACVTLDSSGDLFGTTTQGGMGAGYGTVFEIAHGANSISVVASFSISNISITGGYPQDRLAIDASGDLFGTTFQGGTNNAGTIFEVIRGTISTFASFNVANGGRVPEAGLTFDSSGDLFGTTEEGGTNGDGTVFEIIHGTTSISTIASFNGTNGEYPIACVTLDSSGDIFGTAYEGGASGLGTVFEIGQGTTFITTLASFGGINGWDPWNSPVTLDSSGDLFGTTFYGGANGDGSVFEIAHGTTSITTLASFDGTNGIYPQAGVTIDTSGDLFGTTVEGGVNNVGTVFEIVQGTDSIIPLASFSSGGLGGYPRTGLTLDASGNLFGTTNAGVFEVVQGATSITTLATFGYGGSNGNTCKAGVTLDSSGDLFGTTYYGGANGDGSVFEIVHGTTTITTFASFNGTNGDYCQAGVAVDPSGNLFGTTTNGGTGNEGNVFEIAHGTTSITNLVSFGGTNGAQPEAGLTLDPMGNLFGTTYLGGANGRGTVFEIAHGTTSLTTIANFNLSSGTDPQASVTLDPNGNLFGTTPMFGTGNSGSVFELSLDTSTVSPLSLSLDQNTSYSFGSSSFASAFVNSLNNPLQSIQLPTLPAHGKLTLSGVAVTLNQVIASGSISNLAYTPTSSYSGTDTFGWNGTDGVTYAATASTVNLNVLTSTVTTVTSNDISPIYGQPVTFSASVVPSSGSSETGTIQFQIDGSNAGAPMALTGNNASYNVSGLSLANHSIVAVYSGDTSFAASTSAALVVTPAISVAANDTLVLATTTPGNPSLVASSVSLAGSTGAWTGTLDLANNGLDITAGTFATVSDQIQEGYSRGTWTGPGIISSTAAADNSHLTALGLIQNNQSGSALYNANNPFDGTIPGAGDVLVKYTYYGDANLSGKVDGSDYSLIDNAYLYNLANPSTPLSGWFNGDFNYDNVINGSDYTLIDNAFNSQGASLAAQIAPAGRAAAKFSAGARPAALFSDLPVASFATNLNASYPTPSDGVAAQIFSSGSSDFQFQHKALRRTRGRAALI